MSTFIRTALVALALVGTVSAVSVNANAAPYHEVHDFWNQFTKGS